MERLTAEDQIMLWPDQRWPQEIGAIAILEGEALLDSAGRVRLEAIQRAVGGRLRLVPRFRQLLYQPRRGLGGPLWVDAPAFDLADHVRVVPLPASGDEAALLRTVERLRRQRLDRSRPLWEMCLLPGMPDRRVGLFVRMHHAIADGIAGVASLGAFLDPVPDPPAQPATPWTPEPLPTAAELFADDLRRRGERLGHAVSILAHPATTARQARAAWPGMRDLLAARPAAATSLNRVVGPDRTLALVRSRLDLVRQIAHTHGATINDVLLAVTAGGVRALLCSRGEPVDRLTPRIDVPVTLRPVKTREQARGNLIGQMMVPLPVGVADPGHRLSQIAVETATRKADSHPSVGVMLRSRLVRRALLKLLDRQPVNVTSADLPGPQQPVYLAGARLLEVFPVLSLMGNVSLGVGALSYAGQFNITATADRDAYPDLDIFVTGVRDELAALTAATSVSPGPR
jgi:diacylglycerol O-acyltransferase / wax synthase